MKLTFRKLIDFSTRGKIQTNSYVSQETEKIIDRLSNKHKATKGQIIDAALTIANRVDWGTLKLIKDEK
jgi:hypothetical protein